MIAALVVCISVAVSLLIMAGIGIVHYCTVFRRRARALTRLPYVKDEPLPPERGTIEQAVCEVRYEP